MFTLGGETSKYANRVLGSKTCWKRKVWLLSSLARGAAVRCANTGQSLISKQVHFLLHPTGYLHEELRTSPSCLPPAGVTVNGVGTVEKYNASSLTGEAEREKLISRKKRNTFGQLCCSIRNRILPDRAGRSRVCVRAVFVCYYSSRSTRAGHRT